MVKNIFCPNCGAGTEVDTEKPFFFCPQCGNKVALSVSPQPKPVSPMFESAAPEIKEKAPEENVLSDIINEKLEEVEFYYKTSYDKKEYENTDDEPVYYLKAQDLLVDLSDEYPTDYRIWWELCKPVDFMSVLQNTGGCGQYNINDDYFNKALSNANMESKKRIIAEKDKYEANKAPIIEAEQQRLQEEARQREEAKRQEEARQQEEAKQQEEARRQEEAKRQEEKELALKISRSLWEALKSQDYSRLDNKYFILPISNNQTIVALFKVMANVLYLNAYRIDGSKNAVYKEESMAIQFDESGYGISFSKKPIKIRELMPPDNILRVTLNAHEEIFVNDIQLKSDSEYISNIIKTAKKPLFSTVKIFE